MFMKPLYGPVMCCTVCRHLKSTTLHNVTVPTFVSIWMIAFQYESCFSSGDREAVYVVRLRSAVTPCCHSGGCANKLFSRWEAELEPCLLTFLVPVVPTVHGLLKKQTEQNVAIFHLLSVRAMEAYHCHTIETKIWLALCVIIAVQSCIERNKNKCVTSKHETFQVTTW